MKEEFGKLKNYALVCAIYGTASLLVFALSGHLIHITMVWNLSLAVVPLFAATAAIKVKRKWLKIGWGLIWLVFLPNAFYVLTDFIHVTQLEFFAGNYYDFGKVEYVQNVATYLEMMNIALGYLLATVAGVWAVKKMQTVTKKLLGKFMPITLAILFLLTGYGMYIGRFIRLNSWDVVNVPHLLEKLASGMSWFGLGMSLIFAAYCGAVYGAYLLINRSKSAKV